MKEAKVIRARKVKASHTGETPKLSPFKGVFCRGINTLSEGDLKLEKIKQRGYLLDGDAIHL